MRAIFIRFFFVNIAATIIAASEDKVAFGLVKKGSPCVGTITFFFQENRPPGLLATLNTTNQPAQMKSIPNNGVIEYHPGNSSLYLLKTLDYEEFKEYTLPVKCFLTSSNPLPYDAVLKVVLQDANDNPPKFTKPVYSLSIPEAGALKGQILDFHINVMDLDETSSVSLFIIPGPDSKHFAMQEGSSLIVLLQTLDYEIQKRHVVSILASDGHFNDTATFVLDVTDSDDFSPWFNQKSYSGHVSIGDNVSSENAVTMIGADIRAFDPDLGLNSSVEYSLEDDYLDKCSGWFSINSRTGRVLLNDVSILSSRDCIFLVKATQTDNVLRFNYTLLELSVLVPVQFLKSKYLFRVPSASSIGTIVGRIEYVGSLKDAKVGLSDNGYFRLDDKETYSLITTVAPLTIPPSVLHYNISLVFPGNESGQQADIRIEVIDTELTSPVFRGSSYTFELTERGPQTLGFITVDENINNISVRFALEEQRDSSWFDIDAISGKLSVGSRGLPEASTVFLFKVQAYYIDMPGKRSFVYIAVIVVPACSIVWHRASISVTVLITLLLFVVLAFLILLLYKRQHRGRKVTAMKVFPKPLHPPLSHVALPLSYSCPLHHDVISNGKCRKKKKRLLQKLTLEPPFCKN